MPVKNTMPVEFQPVSFKNVPQTKLEGCFGLDRTRQVTVITRKRLSDVTTANFESVSFSRCSIDELTCDIVDRAYSSDRVDVVEKDKYVADLVYQKVVPCLDLVSRVPVDANRKYVLGAQDGNSCSD